MVSVPETSLISWLSWLMIVSAAITMIFLMLGMRALYGRYAPDITLVIPARLAWAVQEFPSFAIPFFYLCGCKNFAGSFILLLFIVHYFNRTFIYPFQIKSGHGTPWYICLSAVLFCIWNGYIQGSYHGQYYHSSGFFFRPLTYIGFAVFVFGMYVNIQSDNILRSLRNPGETGYKIPRGGMFEYVSGANFFGEIIEWIGYSIVAGSLPAIAFAIFTASNIGPRAIHHHRWYHNKFTDYPKERKAIIPFLL